MKNCIVFLFVSLFFISFSLAALFNETNATKPQVVTETLSGKTLNENKQAEYPLLAAAKLDSLTPLLEQLESYGQLIDYAIVLLAVLIVLALITYFKFLS